MNLIYKRFCLVFGIVAGYFLAMHASTGIFEKSSPPKPVRISVPSKKFLKQVDNDVRLIFSNIRSHGRRQDIQEIVQLYLEMNVLMIEHDFLTAKDLRQIQKIIKLQKQYLADTIKPLLIDRRIISSLLDKTKDAFKEVTLRGFEPDVRHITKFLNTPFHDRRQELDIIANIDDIISHFDGVLITDYDVIVLFHIALAVFLMAETQ
ncbi:MAG TPA: hypothetical protein VLG50_04565 [Candidatus Saccharimonadales bacterium]|nr:hypothetical protein [Candidatus Saccharimonadales bacterium]